MSRYLKALGLALVAAFALSALAVSAASADEFTAAKKPVTLTGSQEGRDVFTTSIGELECEEATYHGTLNATKTTEVTITPKYGKCFIAEIIPAVIDMNTCDYKFTINPLAGKTDGWVDVKCSTSGDKIEITVGAPGTVKCTIKVTEQTVGGITYSNVVGGKVTVKVEASGLIYTEVEGTGLGHCTTSVGDTTNGTYKGAALVEGFEDLTENKEGAAVAISVS